MGTSREKGSLDDIHNFESISTFIIFLSTPTSSPTLVNNAMQPSTAYETSRDIVLESTTKLHENVSSVNICSREKTNFDSI